MDNLTHSLVGLTAAKAGLEKLSPGATALCVLAANAPDADILALFGGRWFYLHHHRGITHSILGTVALAFALPLIFYVVDLLISRIRKRPATVRLRGLLLASLIVTATHPLLDWTNNYGVRFLLPWNSGWFYGDLVFIMDPVFWLVLGGASFLVTSDTRSKVVVWSAIALVPTLLVFLGPAGRGGLSNAIPLRIGWIIVLVVIVFLHTRRVDKRFELRIPQVALGVIVLYLAMLAAVHSVALNRLSNVAARMINSGEHPVAMAAMPTLANPLRWLCVIETERSAYRFELSLRPSTSTTRNVVSFAKPETLASPEMTRASQDHRTQIFLNFARFPIADIVDRDCATQTLVQFADLRYTEPGSQRGTFALEVPVECGTDLK